MDWQVDAVAAWSRDVHWLPFLTIPLFTGVAGWLINWSGLWMLFSPVHFRGVRVPGMRELATVLPRKFQAIPGLLQGGLGWQGIVPARAARMGSIAVDKAIAKLGTPADFFAQLEPDKISAHVVTSLRPEVPRLVGEVMQREHPRLWEGLPDPVRELVVERVQRQLATAVDDVTDQIQAHIDQLLDIKLMVVDHFRDHPALVVRIFRDFGQHELTLMVRFGFVFGFVLGIPVALADSIVGQWWLLPLLGVVVGWVTNALGMWLIFEPPEPRRLLGIRVHGLFLRRQDEAAEIYARIIADDVITLERIGDYLLYGPGGDRTRQLVADALRPAIDRALGPTRAAVRVAVGPARFERIRETMAQQTVESTLTPFRDREFNVQQSDRMCGLVAARTKELPPRDFADMMRSAIREDEWMLYAHGAVMGLAGGFAHLAVFGVGGGG